MSASKTTSKTNDSKTTKPLDPSAWTKVLQTFEGRIGKLVGTLTNANAKRAAAEVQAFQTTAKIGVQLGIVKPLWLANVEPKNGQDSETLFYEWATDLTKLDRDTINGAMRAGEVFPVLTPERQSIPAHEMEALAKVVRKHGATEAGPMLDSILDRAYSEHANDARKRRTFIATEAKVAASGERETEAEVLTRTRAEKKARIGKTADMYRAEYLKRLADVRAAGTDAVKLAAASFALVEFGAKISANWKQDDAKKRTPARDLGEIRDALKVLHREFLAA